MKCGYCGKEGSLSYCTQDCEENSAVYHILEPLTDELDIVFRAMSYPWKVDLTAQSYETLKNRPGTRWDSDVREYTPRMLVYEKGGQEYLVCWENYNIPFIIHARIASRDAAVDRMSLDDFNRPNIQAEYHADWDNWSTNFNETI